MVFSSQDGKRIQVSRSFIYNMKFIARVILTFFLYDYPYVFAPLMIIMNILILKEEIPSMVRSSKKNPEKITRSTVKKLSSGSSGSGSGNSNETQKIQIDSMKKSSISPLKSRFSPNFGSQKKKKFSARNSPNGSRSSEEEKKLSSSRKPLSPPESQEF